MKHFIPLFRTLVIGIILLAAGMPAAAKGAPYQTGFIQWRADEAGFSGWQTSGTALDGAGQIVFDEASAQPETDSYPVGGYYGGNYYNGSSYLVGEATGPEILADFAFKEAIASWNATTPDGSWIETQIRARFGTRWTKWYNLGIWASGTGTVQRHSVRLQGDADGFVAVDTLVLTAKKAAADAFQLKFRLFSASSSAIPSVTNAAVAYSTTPVKPGDLAPGNPDLWNTLLTVPECSQMVYPDGGEVWCSPTSTSMVLGFYGVDPGPCEPRVRAAVAGVYDWIYDGHGNWPFNTAYAFARGHEGTVRRFANLAEAEPYVAGGIPVVVSYAWKKGDLSGAPIPSSGGHLAVLVGFDAAGNPILNDPAAASDADVQRTYLRAEFESLWLEHSGGTVYIIY